MAEYQSKVRAEAPMDLDLTNVKSSVQGLSNMESRLNQLSQVLYRDLYAKKQREGEEYAVKNRPSLKQIADAVAKGEDVKQLFAKQGTVFGDSARVVQAELFRQDLSQNLDRRISDVLTAIDRGAYDVDAETFANDIQAEIDGAYNVLADIDPKAALKWKAHGATVTNTVYDKLNSKQTERYVEEKKATLELQKNAYGTLLAENLTRANGDFAEAIARSMSVKQDLVDAYEALPIGMTDAGWTEIMNLEQEVYKNATTQIIQNTPKLRNNFDNVYSNLIVNNPPKELDFYRYLPEQTKMEIVERVQALNAQQYDIATKQYTLRERNAQQSVAKLKNEFTRLENKTDMDDPDRAEKLKALDLEIERLSVLHPNSVSLSDWNSYKNKEYQDINEFDDDAREIRNKIKQQQFADYPSLEEYVLKNYPTKFATPNEVSATFGKLFDKENESYIDTVSYDTVVEVAPPYYSSTDLRNMKERLSRRIRSVIADNQAFNATVEDPSQMKTTDAKIIADELKFLHLASGQMT